MMDTLFFVASKTIGLLIYPETWLILLAAGAFLALRRGHVPGAKRFLGLAVLGLVTVAILPLGHLLLAPLEARYPANPDVNSVAAIIVLGGAEDESATVFWGQPNVNSSGDRYLAALSLARRFPRAKIYFAGGGGYLSGFEVSEASIAKQILLEAGVNPKRLSFEAASRNTAENAANLRKTITQLPSGQILLVTSAAHMPRAIASFCAAGWSRLVAWPVDYSTGAFSDGIGWDLALHLVALNHGVKEWVGLFAYWLTGRTQTLFGADCRDEPKSEQREQALYQDLLIRTHGPTVAIRWT